jgi:peptidoglycan/LPS O-acetylase OafA/YrhL
MGLIRTLLAIAVVLNHIPPYDGIHLIHGPLAVEAFFVISGFYMALVLSERYDGQVGRFYWARALRIFPMYWAVLALAWYLNGPPLGKYFAQLDFIDSAKVVGASLLLYGHELFQFTQIYDGKLAWDLSRAGAVQTGHLMLIPPAWSLGIELTFYALVPFLVRLRSGWLVGICVASLALRQSQAYLSLWGPWTSFGTPFVLCFFILGMLSYRLGKKTGSIPRSASLTLLAATLLELFLGPFLGRWAGWLLFGTMIVALPHIFEVTKRSKIDDAIGQLSYPIYLCHLLVIQFAAGSSPVNAILGSAVGAAVLVLLFSPIERLRSRRGAIPITPDLIRWFSSLRGKAPSVASQPRASTISNKALRVEQRILRAGQVDHAGQRAVRPPDPVHPRPLGVGNNAGVERPWRRF